MEICVTSETKGYGEPKRKEQQSLLKEKIIALLKGE